MFGDAWRRGHQSDQVVAPVHGFDRADAEFLQRSFAEDGTDQVFETGSLVVRCWSLANFQEGRGFSRDRSERNWGVGPQISSPAAQIDSGNYHLAEAGAYQRLNFEDHFGRAQRAALTSNVGDYAEGAPVVAAVLHFQVGASALVRGVKDRGGLEFSVGEDVGDEDWASDLGPRTLNARREPCQRDEAFHLWTRRAVEISKPRSEV